MNPEIRVVHPRPAKTMDHVFFKTHIIESNTKNILNSENILEDLSKLRGNSQNPQEKDDSFKSQSEPLNVDDFQENWSDYEEIFSL